jgi:hypothetical protein
VTPAECLKAASDRRTVLHFGNAGYTVIMIHYITSDASNRWYNNGCTADMTGMCSSDVSLMYHWRIPPAGAVPGFSSSLVKLVPYFLSSDIGYICSYIIYILLPILPLFVSALYCHTPGILSLGSRYLDPNVQRLYADAWEPFGKTVQLMNGCLGQLFIHGICFLFLPHQCQVCCTICTSSLHICQAFFSSTHQSCLWLSKLG